MTRVNLYIPPAHLCDQHLIAEVHELPRLWSARLVSAPPAQFTLGKGHVLFCREYLKTMGIRYELLTGEMAYRGFNVTHPDAPLDCFAGKVLRVSGDEVARVIDLLRDRIRERLASMKRAPTWTRRERPSWTLPNYIPPKPITLSEI